MTNSSYLSRLAWQKLFLSSTDSFSSFKLHFRSVIILCKILILDNPVSFWVQSFICLTHCSTVYRCYVPIAVLCAISCCVEPCHNGPWRPPQSKNVFQQSKKSLYNDQIVFLMGNPVPEQKNGLLYRNELLNESQVSSQPTEKRNSAFIAVITGVNQDKTWLVAALWTLGKWGKTGTCPVITRVFLPQLQKTVDIIRLPKRDIRALPCIHSLIYLNVVMTWMPYFAMFNHFTTNLNPVCWLNITSSTLYYILLCHKHKDWYLLGVIKLKIP